jgi:hypothetical protein
MLKLGLYQTNMKAKISSSITFSFNLVSPSTHIMVFFVSGWEFFKNDDPTHGFVKYEPEDTAKSKQLAVIGGDGVVTLSVDDKSTPPEGMKVSDNNPYNRSACVPHRLKAVYNPTHYRKQHQNHHEEKIQRRSIRR